MKPAIHPTHQQVREWMRAQARKESPPPTPEQIRRELGWGMVAQGGRLQEVPR